MKSIYHTKIRSLHSTYDIWIKFGILLPNQIGKKLTSEKKIQFANKTGSNHYIIKKTKASVSFTGGLIQFCSVVGIRLVNPKDPFLMHTLFQVYCDYYTILHNCLHIIYK